jgi:hypothetical protein
MGVVLRLTATLAVVVGLAAFGLAIGDFASHPNPVGAIGLVLLAILGGAAIRQLYRPGGVLSRRPAPPRPEREPEPPEPKRRRPSQRATSASLFDD